MTDADARVLMTVVAIRVWRHRHPIAETEERLAAIDDVGMHRLIRAVRCVDEKRFCGVHPQFERTDQRLLRINISPDNAPRGVIMNVRAEGSRGKLPHN